MISSLKETEKEDKTKHMFIQSALLYTYFCSKKLRIQESAIETVLAKMCITFE